MREKIETLIKIYKKMLEKEKNIIAETKGKPKVYYKWLEAVSNSSCYNVIIKDLEALLKEWSEEEDR